jgi:hypothetical protein
MPSSAPQTGRCIVCSCETSDRTESGGRKHWRCPPTEHDQCADRRDMRRRRPKHRAKDIDAGLSRMCAMSDEEAIASAERIEATNE